MPPKSKIFAKARARLTSFGVEVVKEPTGQVVIFNGGRLNNISKSKIESFIRTATEMANLQMKVFMPKKSYSIVELQDKSLCEILTNLSASDSEKPLFLQDEKSKDVSILFFHISSAGEGDLEDILPEKPEGLELFENLISKEEEDEIEKEVMKKMDSSELKHRQVVHFGHHFDYTTNSGSKEDISPIPDAIERIRTKLVEDFGEDFDQITANIYTPGDGIPPHIMARKNDYPDGNVRERGNRISLTFRRCIDDEEEAARIIEKNLVKDVYDHIADDFSASRYKMWPLVEEFVDQVPKDHFVVDLGCGNGKNLLKIKDRGLGLELSSNLAKICGSRNIEVAVGDCTRTQLRDEICDVVISIAVLHHMSSVKRRVEALKEIGRILRPGGKAMVTSWAMEQTNEEGKASNYAKKENSAKSPNSAHLPIHKARTNFEAQDVLVPFKGSKEGKSTDPAAKHRFYHVFIEGEMKSLAQEAGCFQEIKEVYDDGNYVLFLRKSIDK
ncbi:Oidioi.mRNA.OKI2018_I69.chr1.g186.t1.cds [Oikopleura dioica]|uniref:Oidioi.mRNA.OKI2018_I69.chr1.g186.t1.cds n=1 Tax=Oikopleura dioica TaxID=34765 RepID=A0ABN7SJ29_OIKDI|nr:Oidioi.mRNA.OKI2018_I69.chr1.g186.t1.cds [Oikopleura dioica]